MRRWADHPASAYILAVIAFSFTALSAKPFAGSWNDGSRLASVESLVERNTFSIDGSVFLELHREHFDANTPPFDPEQPLLRSGTQDKLLINGHYYSDKPPLVSLPLAGAYRILMLFGLPKPSDRPDIFAYVVCLLLSGTGYAVAVGCMWNLGKRVGLTPGWRLAWLACFAFATVLPAYTRFANNHIAQLGAVAAVCVLLCRVSDATRRAAWGSVIAVGFLAGFAYNLDFGIGPPFVLAVLAIVALRTRSVRAVAACGLAALPCIISGHLINYNIGGDWLRPLNMHPEYLNWPGSPFGTTMTGVVRTRYFAQFTYTLDLLVGKKGFLTHNLPLLLAVGAGIRVLKRSGRHRLELVVLGAWCVVSWLMYGVLSKNHGGWCVSIRWFVPFLAPGFWLLAKVLVERPQFRRDFVLLSAWSAVLAASAWTVGTWWPRNVPLYWWVFGGSLITWGVLHVFARRAKIAAHIQKQPATREVEAETPISHAA